MRAEASSNAQPVMKLEDKSMLDAGPRASNSTPASPRNSALDPAFRYQIAKVSIRTTSLVGKLMLTSYDTLLCTGVAAV